MISDACDLGSWNTLVVVQSMSAEGSVRIVYVLGAVKPLIRGNQSEGRMIASQRTKPAAGRPRFNRGKNQCHSLDLQTNQN